MPTAPDAVAAINGYLDHYLDKLLELIPGAALGQIEAVHDARSALRRVVSVHRGYGRQLFPIESGKLREARAVIRHLGSIRDPQVALQRLSDPPLPQDIPSLPALRQALVDQAGSGLDRLHPKQLRRRADEAASGLRLADADFSDQAAGALLQRQWDLCERLRTEAEAYPPGAARWMHLHLERKALKRLRYMAESLEAWADEGARKVADAARQRQDALGSLNDCWQLELWLVDSIRIKGVDEADIVRLLGAEDGALRACDVDYRRIASEPIPKLKLPGSS